MRNLKEEARAAERPEPKRRRASPKEMQPIKDFMARLHTFARDQRDWLRDPETTESAYEALVIIMADLADMVQAEYDRING